MIKVINLNKVYYKNNKKIIALDNVNLSFEKGKVYGIKGESGSGKTTLLQLIGLLDNPTSGSIIIDNKIINSDSTNNNLSKIRGEKIGFIFQKFYLNNDLSILENVMLPMFVNNSLSKSEIRDKAFKLLKAIGLEERIDHFPSELSGGEQQRVAIARALSNNPNIILADEPTGNLDEKNEKMILSILKELSEKGCCVIIATHSNEIKKYADEIINLNLGKVNKK